MSVFVENVAYKPFVYPELAEASQRHMIDMHWDVHQLNLQDDIQQYNSSNGLKTANVSHAQNKNILKRTLCLFTEMEITVGGGYVKRLQYICNNEAIN